MQAGRGVDRVVVLVERILQRQHVGEDGADEVEADPADADPEEESQRLARLLFSTPMMGDVGRCVSGT